MTDPTKLKDAVREACAKVCEDVFDSRMAVNKNMKYAALLAARNRILALDLSTINAAPMQGGQAAATAPSQEGRAAGLASGAAPTSPTAGQVAELVARLHMYAIESCGGRLEQDLLQAAALLSSREADGERYQQLLDDPETGRHLLLLLSQKRGDKAAFSSMLDRIKESKNAARAKDGGDKS
jgi:hypothetical protein